MYQTAPFIKLGQIVDEILYERPLVFDELVRLAKLRNPWFTAESIRLAMTAISKKMLQKEKLDQWLEPYPFPKNFTPKNIGIIMAGNIPLVGFFDLLCVCVSGNRAYIKSSSKDNSLIKRAAKSLSVISHKVVIETLEDDTPLDAVIATGSDNTNRYFRSKYGDIPNLLRGNRTSVAVLNGNETDADLKALAHDVFDYFGMGCRNVSKVFIPENYDVTVLVKALKNRNISHPNYLNAYRHHKALLQMRGADFMDGGFFTLRQSDGLSEALPDIIYTPYTSIAGIKKWLDTNDQTIQCVVTSALRHPREVGFGQAQMPELADYPDGKDVIAFLNTLQ